jgi:hypothetical protein
MFARRMPGPRTKHYLNNEALYVGERLAAQVLHGGQNKRPNVIGSGFTSPVVVAALRGNFVHFPSRLDSKTDVVGPPGLFEELRGFSFALASEFGIRPPKEYRNNDRDQGDTVTLGSRESPFFLRIYQPGLKRAQQDGRTGDNITADQRNAVRIELEFKPQKPHAKSIAATISPEDVWALSPWVAAFAQRVFAMDVRPISISERRESNQDRALRFMGKQYTGHLHSLFRQCNGDLAAYGAAIADLAGIDYAQ